MLAFSAFNKTQEFTFTSHDCVLFVFVAGFPQFSHVPVPVHLRRFPGHSVGLPPAALPRLKRSHAFEREP